MSVHRYLVTSGIGPRMDTWAATAAFANWIEGRKCGDREDRETWLVTCFDEHSEAFLAAGRAAGVTVEAIEGAGDTETYKLLVGEPGTGWTPSSAPEIDDDLADDPADGQDCQASHCPPSATQDCDWPRCAGERP